MVRSLWTGATGMIAQQTNLDVIAEVAAEQGYIKPEDKEKLIKFRNNPSDESWIGEV